MRRIIRTLALGIFLYLFCAVQFAQTPSPTSQPPTRTAASGVTQDRLDAIERSIKAIETECAVAAGGDWNAWFQKLAPYRAEMREKFEAGRARGGPFLLEVAGNPPLLDDPNDLQYLWEDGDLDSWLKRRTTVEGVVQATRWLEKRNIDVIFVPVPKMTDVYPDGVAQNVPADRIVAPQVRRLLLDLLKANVEVVDLLPLFQAARRQSAEPLYFSDDSHWAPRAQAIAVRAIAERLKRYPSVKTALARPAMFREKQVATTFGDGCWRPALTPAQLAQIRDYSWPGVQILNRKDQPVAAEAASPVMVIGDSFATVALLPGMSLDALLAHQINLPVSRRTASAGTVDAIKDFAREPELLQGRKVIVWVAYNGTVSGTTIRWNLPKLPELAAER